MGDLLGWKNTNIFSSDEKCKNISIWWKIQMIFQSGLIVMDEPRWKMQRFFCVVKMWIFQGGEKYEWFFKVLLL